MEKNIKRYYKIAEESYNKQYEIYTKNALANFELSSERIRQLNDFFLSTNNQVLENLFKNYNISITGSRSGDCQDFTINVPVIVSSRYLTSLEIKYLKILYLDKLAELNYDKIGITEVNIIKKRWTGSKISNSLYLDVDKGITYVLKAHVSISKMYVKNKKLMRTK